jgi:hypothetical protein
MAGEREIKDMDEQTFQTKFNELLNKIKDLPEGDRGRLEELAEETKQRRDRIQASVTELQESLDYLRLSVKYLVFDLEATRRENAYLRKLVEQSNREQNRGPNHDDQPRRDAKNSRNGRKGKPRRGNPEHDEDNFLDDQGASGAD